MTIIKVDLIKKLRQKTGSGFLECKLALIKSSGNINLAIDYLRRSGSFVANLKNNCKTSSGSIFFSKNKNFSVLLELTSETDFSSNNSDFCNFGQEIANYSANHNIQDINFLRKNFDFQRIQLISKMKENIIINRMASISGQFVSSYLHNKKIGSIVSWKPINLKNSFENNFGKKIAMHIAATNPLYLCMNDIPSKVLLKEREIQIDLAKKYKKNSKVLEKIIYGKMKKIMSTMCLMDQFFIFDLKQTVKIILKLNNIQLISFFRLEVGK